MTRNDVPDRDRPVVFQADDGRVIATLTTDDHGVAGTMLDENATVSVIQPVQVSTFIAVPPGDHLALATYDAPKGTQNVALTIPSDPDPSVTTYFVNQGCGDLHGTVVAEPLDCGAANDVLVRSESGQNDVGVLVAMDVPIVAGTMTVPGTFAPFTDETFAITNANGVTGAIGYTAIVGSHGPMTFHAESLDLTTGSTSFSTPSLVQAGVNQEVTVTGFTGAVVQIIHAIQPTSATFSLDFGAATLPSYTAPPSLDITNHRVTWQPSGGVLTPDVTFARIPIVRGELAWQWYVVAPYIAGELALPTLPITDQFDFNPQPGDSADVFSLEQLNVPGGYDAIRANALSAIDDANTSSAEYPIRIDPSTASQTVAALFSR